MRAVLLGLIRLRKRQVHDRFGVRHGEELSALPTFFVYFI
jgi:hypothetical protein